MTEYWKSNDRKWCDFCKCWLTDNKPSVQFHENGKRHKLNVSKRLSEIGKQSEVDLKNRQKNDEDMRKMNDAAMRAYMHDISTGADFTSRAISQANAIVNNVNVNGDASTSSATIELDRAGRKRQLDPMMPPFDPFAVDDEKRNTINSQQDEVKDPSLWCEALTENGDTYYWNVKTNESVWKKPKEGFLTLKEYEKLNEEAVRQHEEKQNQDMLQSIQCADEMAAKYKREKNKKLADRINPPPEPEQVEGPQYEGHYGGQPYGKWQEVKYSVPKKIDLELPEQNYNQIYVPAACIKEEAPVRKFKEKTVTSLDMETTAPGFFKKRKIGGTRNARQRTSDD